MSYDQYCISADQDGFRSLMIVAANGHHECLSILLAHGAEVDKTTAVSAVSVCRY